MKKERNNGLDLLRIVSAFAVILLHSNALFLFADEAPVGTILIIENIINLITRFCVPVFVMISGMFLLGNDENEKIGLFYKHSLVKIGIPYIGMIIFWVALSLFQLITNRINLMHFIKSLITLSYGNLWFMPMLIGLYLLTPFLNRLIKTITPTQLKMASIFIIVWAVVSQPVSTFSVPYSIGVVFAYLGYFLMGYALKEVHPDKQIMIRGGVLLAVALAISMIMRLRGFELYMRDAYVSFFSPTVVILSIYIFAFFKDIKCMNVSWLSGKTYYIYLLHTPIYILINNYFVSRIEVNDILKIIILTITTFITATFGSVLYSKLCECVMGKVRRKALIFKR